MEHYVARHGNRLLVVYDIPGLPGCASAVTDYPLQARRAADQDAHRLTLATRQKVEPSPEERKVPAGFYADQGALF